MNFPDFSVNFLPILEALFPSDQVIQQLLWKYHYRFNASLYKRVTLVNVSPL